jgi:hypothetical protein
LNDLSVEKKEDGRRRESGTDEKKGRGKSSHLAGEVVGGSTFSPLLGRACACYIILHSSFFLSRSREQMVEAVPDLVLLLELQSDR